MDKFNGINIAFIDPLQGITRKMDDDRKKLDKSINEFHEEKRKKEEEKEKREQESLDIGKQTLEVQKSIEQIQKNIDLKQELMLFYMKSMSNDNKKIVGNIEKLIDVAEIGFKVGEANLAIIEEELQKLKINDDGESIQEKFVDLIKEKMLDHGAEYAIMFFFSGIKYLFSNGFI
mgnify:CR=1 FL=1